MSKAQKRNEIKSSALSEDQKQIHQARDPA